MITAGDRDLIVFAALVVIITLLVLAALYVTLKSRDGARDGDGELD